MSFNFVNITPALISAADKKPGHSDVLYVCPIANFTAIAGAVNDGTPGSTKLISATHTHPANKGFIKVQCKAKSIDPTADAQGEAGGQVPNFKYKVIIKGDSPEILEFVEQILNEDLIAIFNGPVCGVDNFTQLGSECSPAQISGFAFRGGSRSNGGFKEYEFTIESSEKFFYEGTITEHIDANLVLAAPSEPLVSGLAATTATLTWGAVANAEEYEIERSTSSDFSAPVQETITAPTVTKAYTGLTTATTYYFRVRAVATGYVTGDWAVSAFTTA
jgi:hypothetical protein